MGSITREDRALIFQLHEEKKRLRDLAKAHRTEARRLQVQVKSLSVKALAEKFETTDAAVLAAIHGEYSGKPLLTKKDLD